MPAAEATGSFTIGANYAARKTAESRTSVRIARRYRTTVSSFLTCIIKKTKRNLSGHDLLFQFSEPVSKTKIWFYLKDDRKFKRRNMHNIQRIQFSVRHRFEGELCSQLGQRLFLRWVIVNQTKRLDSYTLVYDRKTDQHVIFMFSRVWF